MTERTEKKESKQEKRKITERGKQTERIKVEQNIVARISKFEKIPVSAICYHFLFAD